MGTYRPDEESDFRMKCKLCNGLMVVGSATWWKVFDDCPNCDGTGEEK
jgi:hypothetical protein